MQQRTITFYSSISGVRKLETAETKWGAIKALAVREFGLTFDKLTATLGSTKANLVLDDAEVPAENAVIFLRQKDAKGGADYSILNYKELRDVIKKEGQNLKQYISQNCANGNWTRATTDELKRLVNEYMNKSENTQKSVKPVENKTEAEPVQKIQETQAAEDFNIEDLLNVLSNLESQALNIENPKRREEIIVRLGVIEEKFSSVKKSIENVYKTEEEILAEEYRKLFGR